jgi:hypothetical protein
LLSPKSSDGSPKRNEGDDRIHHEPCKKFKLRQKVVIVYQQNQSNRKEK